MYVFSDVCGTEKSPRSDAVIFEYVAGGKRPSPDRIIKVIAASAGGKHGLVVSQNLADNFSMCIVCQLEMCQGITGKGIHSQLQHKYVRNIGVNQRDDKFLKYLKINYITNPERQGDVYVKALSTAIAYFIFISRAGPQGFAAFMKRNYHDFIA